MGSIRRMAGAASALLLMSPCTLAQQPPESAGSFTKTADIIYAAVDGRELGLDLYVPKGVANPPLLVWVHGGAWQRRSKEDIYTLALVDYGYAMASPDFRLSVDATFPAQIHDIKGAIRFLRANAAAYGYDASRVGIIGRSSGGHLSSLVAVTDGHQELEGRIGDHLDQSSDVQVAVSYFGASNLTTILKQSTPFGVDMRAPAVALLLGGPLEEKMELARLASPVFHVDAGDPPLLMLHGDQDPQMPINQSHELHGAYKAKGLTVQFEVVHGAEHGGEAFFDAKRTALVAAFLDEHLR